MKTATDARADRRRRKRIRGRYRSASRVHETLANEEPGSSPLPSGTDEETFDRCFGTPDWAVMFILATHGATYARLRFNVGPQTRKRLGVRIDYQTEFPGADYDAWLSEYEDSIQVHDPFGGRDRWMADEVAEPWSAFGEPEAVQLADQWAVL